MTDTIISSNISNLTLNHKMVLFGKDGTDTKIDISKMFKDESEAYIEVTTISKVYGKKFKVWQRSKEVQIYIRRLEEVLKGHNYDPLDKAHKIRTHQDNTKAKVNSKLIKRKAGRYGGTYLHKKLALKYFRWLDVDFEIAIDIFLEELYKQITVTKINRADTKLTFKPLTDVIKDIYIPNQIYQEDKIYAYADIMNLINIKVLNKTAKQFRRLHNIPDKKSIHTRDYLTELQLENIKYMQEKLHTLILIGITDLKELDKMINKIPLLNQDDLNHREKYKIS